MIYRKRAAVVLLNFLSIFIATGVCAETVAVSGKVTDEHGQPIDAATVAIGGVTHRSGTLGEFTAATPLTDIYRLRVSAPGYFSFIHTFSRADVLKNERAQAKLTVPPIALVRRKKNRRLLVFGGDTMMGRRYLSPLPGEPALIRSGTAFEDTRAILQHVRPYLELADFASVNLESQLSDEIPAEPLAKSVTFYSPTAVAQALRWAGVDYVALGNNHMFDYRDAGLQRTLGVLDRAGLGYSGAGSTAADARRPYTTSIGGQQLDLLSYVGWPGGFEPNQVAAANKGGAALGTERAIAGDLQPIHKNSVSILQYHSGLEYVSRPPLAEETQLKLAIDNGADLALGHHSHVYQGVEIYKGKLIAYSLGNFVFDQYLYSTHSAILLFAWYDGDDFYRAEVVPLHLNAYVPTPATGAIRYDTLQRLVRLSDPESVCWSHSGGHAAFRACAPGEATAVDQELRFSGDDPMVPGSLLSLSLHDVDPLRPVRAVYASGSYRAGLDLLRRGDFETVGLFGTHDRTWIEDRRISFRHRETMLMNISLDSREKLTTGMKVFTRVFSRSSPATVAVKIRSSGCAKFRFYLQRRPDGMSFSDALHDGPIATIGEFVATSQDWYWFALDFGLPRTATRGIRLLVDIENCDDDDSPIDIQLDDLALLEWQTPWYGDGEPMQNADRVQATHLQFRPRK